MKNITIIESLSLDRLKSYEILCPNGSEAEIIGAYNWNLLISKALYPFLHSAEIAFRNAMNQAVSEKFNSQNWFDDVIKDDTTTNTLKKTRDELTRKKQDYGSSDIVASLTFGFWTTLLKQKIYAQPENQYRLWPELLPTVFPNYANADQNLKQIRKRFEEIKLLRNRIFHHEPIWKFKTAQNDQESIRELRNKFNDIFKAIGWISAQKRNSLRTFGFVEFFKENCTLEKLNEYKEKTPY